MSLLHPVALGGDTEHTDSPRDPASCQAQLPSYYCQLTVFVKLYHNVDIVIVGLWHVSISRKVKNFISPTDKYMRVHNYKITTYSIIPVVAVTEPGWSSIMFIHADCKIILKYHTCTRISQVRMNP